MRFFLFILIFLATGNNLFAQHSGVYPDSPDLRKALLQLVSERAQGFQNIRGDLAYKKGTVTYYNATLHLTDGDTARIAEDRQPLQIYYLDFLAQNLNTIQSKAVFEKWLNLLQMALPEFSMRVSGDQFADLEGFEFASPDGISVIYLYRNGNGAACQVAITIINDNAAEVVRFLDHDEDEDE